MPITPIPEQLPLKRPKNSIDWTDTLDALAGDPGEWFKVDGPLRGAAVHAREKSLARFAAGNNLEVEVTHRNVDGAHWIYARLVPAKTKPAPEPAPKPAARPVAPVPDPPTEAFNDPDSTHPHACDLCGDTFRTNTRLRQHQANAHKAYGPVA